MYTKIYGHRGCMGMMPENTLLGFEQAIRDGVDGLELDIHLTKDGEVVVIHDERLDRTTNGSGYVKDLTLTEIKKYSAGIHYKSYPEGDSKWKKEKVLTLKEVLELMRPYETELNIELKTNLFQYEGIEEKVLSIVEQYGEGRKVIYSSFHLPTIMRIKQTNPAANVAWLLNQTPAHPKDYLDTLGIDALHLNQFAVHHLVYDLRDMYDKVRVWTVNNSNDIKEMLGLRVGAIITDYPKDALFFKNERKTIV